VTGFLERLLGHDVPRFPYDCTVEYVEGERDVLHFWAQDVREALQLCIAWMPTRAQTATRIEMVKRS
jgi:hypothetical protein